MSKTRADKVARSAGHRSDREVQSFKRAIRSSVDEDKPVDDRIRGWREGGSYNWSNSRYFLKFFQSRVGQKWNDVISELFADIKDPAFRKEALSNVEVNTYYTEDGQLAYHPVGYRGILRLINIVKDQRDLLYVEDGILKRNITPRKTHDFYAKFRTNGYYDGRDLYVRKDGIWYRIDKSQIFTPAQFSKIASPHVIHVRRNEHTKENKHKIIKLYVDRYEVKKKQLSKKKLKKLRNSHPYLDQDVVSDLDGPIDCFYL